MEKLDANELKLLEIPSQDASNQQKSESKIQQSNIVSIIFFKQICPTSYL